MAQALVLIAALALAGCGIRDSFVIPTPTGKPACGVIVVHKADGTTERHGRPCA